VAGVRSAAAGGSLIDEIVYDGAVRMLAAALQDAVTAFIRHRSARRPVRR
jgi:hypothetical protein